MLLDRLRIPRRGKGKQREGSILDLPFTLYDSNSGLPRVITINDKPVRPLVTVAQARDHLILLGAFRQLANDSSDFHRVCESAAFEYEQWARAVVPNRGKKRGSGSGGYGDGSGSPTSFLSVSSGASSSSPPKPLRKDELPTITVLMCWHAHMLNPHQYSRDTEGTYAWLSGLPFPLAEAAAAIKDGSLPCEIEHASAFGLRAVPSISGWTPPDVAAAVQRQAKFIANMDRIGWLDKAMFNEDLRPLQRGIVRYHAWLDLMAAHECKIFLVPTLDIDLAWHTHQLLGPRYRHDTELLLNGTYLAHNDNAGDGKIDEGFKRTAALWKSRFGYDY